MKRKYVLVAIAIIGIISWSQTISATEVTLPDTGTIDYGTFRKDVTFSRDVDLDYVYSSISEEAMTVELWEPYNSTTDTIRYMFTSEAYNPEYWEHLDQEPFIYQDNNSGHLYIISINMSGIEIPEDPWKVDYINLSGIYNDTWNELNIIIHNLTIVKEELEELISLYENVSIELNITSTEKELLEESLFAKIVEIAGLEADLNTTKDVRDSALSNATTFRRFFDEMNSYKADFSFKLGGDSEQYTTIYEYEITEERLKNQIAGFPLILIFSIAVTMTLCLMLGYWKWSSKRSSPEELEMIQGVNPTATKINRMKARLPFRPKNVKIKTPDATLDDRYETMKNEVGEKMKTMDTKIDSNHKELLSLLNEALKGTGKKETPTLPG